MQFRLVFFICSNLIEFGKARISIFRCQHALPIKMQTVFVAASISNQIWMRFSGKHLNYFRRNVSILNLCFGSWNVHLFRLTCATLPAFIFRNRRAATTFSFLLCCAFQRRCLCSIMHAKGEQVSREQERNGRRNIATKYIQNTKISIKSSMGILYTLTI